LEEEREEGLDTLLLICHFLFALIRIDKIVIDFFIYCHFVCVFLLGPLGGEKEDLIH